MRVRRREETLEPPARVGVRERLRRASDQVEPERRLHRHRRGRVVAGIAAGIADHVGLPVVVVRLVFVALTIAGGTGLGAYAVFWLVLPQQEGPAPDSEGGDQQAVVLAVGGTALLVLLTALGFASETTLPLFAAAGGLALVWRQADDAQRARLRPGVPGVVLRSVLGVGLVVLGIVAFLVTQGDLRAAREGLLSTAIVVAGLVLLALPWVSRTLTDLREERRERIRSQERAELSAQVHDSVLQTLALIQRAADDPREVARLARAQERELRTWLYRPGDRAGAVTESLTAALERVAADVELAHGVRVEVVVVGDLPSEPLGPLVAATREAVVNAAKHARVDLVEVYAEVEEEQVSVFVRDRGVGFVPQEVPADRFGLAESVRARMARAGGTAHVRTGPGEGTEIRLELPRGARG